MAKIKYGISNCHYATATIAANGSATYGTIKDLPGAVSLSLDAQGDTNNFFADNIVYYTSVANNGYEGDLELAMFTDDFYKDILGFKADSKGVLYEDAGAEPVHFALTFQVETDTGPKRVVLYNCVAQRPSVAASTKEETIEPQTETISITCTTIYNATKDVDMVRASCTSAQTAQYNAWNSSIYVVTS